MKITKDITCRYGITYKLEGIGQTKGSIFRLFDLMTHCCCYVCHNHECKNPRNEKIPNCENVCEIYSKQPYCIKENYE